LPATKFDLADASLDKDGNFRQAIIKIYNSKRFNIKKGHY
jgi:hypothetical protein